MSPRIVRLLAWGSLLLAAGCGSVAAAIASQNGPVVVAPDFGSVITSVWATIGFSVGLLMFSVVGTVIALRRPDNGLGWLFCGSGLVLAFSNLSSTYAVHGLSTNPGSLPGADWFGLLSDALWIPVVTMSTVFLFLWFPEGRPVQTGRRRANRVTIVAVIVAVVTGALGAKHLYQFESIPNPLGIRMSEGLAGSFVAASYFALLGTLLYSIGSLVQRLRRATGDERLQLRWFVYAACLALVAFVPSVIVKNSPIVQILGGLTLLSLPIAVAISVLRYRLYEIDVVISKTLVYGALAAFITLVYVAIVIGLGAMIGASGDNLVLSVLATAIVALAFQPLRARVQKVANRLVYGERATPYEILTRFSERVAGTYATEDVLPRTARVIAEGTRAERVEIWLRLQDHLRLRATWPEGEVTRGTLRLDGEDLPRFEGTDRVLPVLHQGELLGVITLSSSLGEGPTPAEERLLSTLVSQTGLVLSNVRLTADLEARLEQIQVQAAELRASRQRIVAAQDEERRRLERNIHDGAQQHLVALAVKLRLAKGFLNKDPGRAASMLSEIREEIGEALDTLTSLSLGIYPPLLEAQGLAAALAAQYQRSDLPVHLSVEGTKRYPIETEAAIYFSVLESLQNAAKYARANSVEVTIAEVRDGLSFTVSDDGAGFDAATTARGSGLQNIADRLSTLGGNVDIRSEPGVGTTIEGWLPVFASAEAP